jgi:hypothetical protein
MSTSKTMIGRIGRGIIVGAAAVGMTVGLATAPAQPATGMSAKLTIRSENADNAYWVAVDGLIPMSRYAAQGYINNGATMQLRLWGDDPASDNLRYGRTSTAVVPAADRGSSGAPRTASISSARSG